MPPRARESQRAGLVVCFRFHLWVRVLELKCSYLPNCLTCPLVLLQVGTNGIISTQDFPRETQYVDDDFPTDFPAIAPFLADIDTSHGRGRILYREDTSPAVLRLAARYVRTGFPRTGSSFTPTHAFLATWVHVGAYEEVRRGAAPSGEVSEGYPAAELVEL